MGPACGCDKGANEAEAIVKIEPEKKLATKDKEIPVEIMLNPAMMQASEQSFEEMMLKVEIPNGDVKRKREALGSFAFQRKDIKEGFTLHSADKTVPGETYSGYMSDQKKSREYKGIIVFSDGGILEGHFFENFAHGIGRRITVDLGVYEGLFDKGDYNGRGKFSGVDGGYYDGEWKDGKQHGIGEELEPGKGKYVGEYINGQRQGKGTFILSDGSEYDGEWANGKQEGKGTLNWKSGKKYTGEWKGGLQQGFGTMWFPTGERYEGEFEDGKMHGKGKRIWDNGNTAEGTFMKGKLEGEAIITTGGVNPQKSEWKDGVLKKIIGPAQKWRL